jgi:alpha-ketoglutarate-dependent taurine dioxygenase
MQKLDKLQMFLDSEPQEVQASSPIRTRHLADGSFPLVVEPVLPDVDLTAWARSAKSWIETELHQNGALLFRGFGVSSVPRFEEFARSLCNDLFGEYGDLPTEQGGEKVYQSTPYPSNKTILFHNESSHMHRWPLKQLFFCVQPARERGETPIVDCRRLYQALPADVVRRFEEKQLLYVRNFTEGLDVSWQDFFRTADRSRVESYCRGAGIDFEWTPSGLRTRQAAVAVTRHPQSGEPIFFNQVQLHHIACLEPELREALGQLFPEDDFPRNVYFGDGSRIEDSIMEEVSRAYWENSVSFSWQAGDILLLDNMLVAHARNPYVGPRKIVVAMGEMFEKQDLPS